LPGASGEVAVVANVTVPALLVPGCEYVAVSPDGSVEFVIVTVLAFPTDRVSVIGAVAGVASCRTTIDGDVATLSASTGLTVSVSVAVEVAVPSVAETTTGYVPGIAVTALVKNNVPKFPVPGCVIVIVTPAGTPVAETVIGFVLPTERSDEAITSTVTPPGAAVTNGEVSARERLSAGVALEDVLDEQPVSTKAVAAASRTRVRFTVITGLKTFALGLRVSSRITPNHAVD